MIFDSFYNIEQLDIITPIDLIGSHYPKRAEPQPRTPKFVYCDELRMLFDPPIPDTRKKK